jgi:hypothetical protein
MSESRLVEHRYAYTPERTIIDIQDLTPEDRRILGPFTCIGCGRELIAKMGTRRQKHFAHKQQVICNRETYLHQLAKTTFYETYRRCLAEGQPFCIELRHTRICTRFESILKYMCLKHHGTKREYDLTSYYTDIEMEKHSEGFVPDVRLIDPTRPSEDIYIEIAVTHFLSEEKQRSGKRIIEIPIEHEDDIGPISRCFITEEQARFVNFRRGPVIVADGECICADQSYAVFTVHANGESYLKVNTARDIEDTMKREGQTIQYISINSQAIDHVGKFMLNDYNDIFTAEAERAYSRGHPIRTCFLCRYAGTNLQSITVEPIYCRKFKQVCTSNAAVKCNSFWLREGIKRRM